MLDIQYVSRSFKKVLAVDNVSLSVAPGEIVGFLGPNGAGKTTTMKLAVGLLRPDRGRVLVCGHDVQIAPAQARTVLGYIPDVPALYPRLTGWETLDFVGDAFRLEPAEKIRKAHELVDLFGLGEWMTRQVETYSHGTRQKLAWAASLLHDPQVLLLDEPTVGLDPANSRLIKDVIVLLKQRGCAILMSSHLLPMVEELADRMVMISRGRLVAEGTLAQLRESAAAAGHVSLEEMFLKLTGTAEQSEKAAGLLGKGR
ncbi:MAG TPA: ABC transporter ATP-binding protein [Symbiobacteriaceae bacterium]|nr:ABC transporter ATP-binding protein [Symbiobacteriaceae bacterium]